MNNGLSNIRELFWVCEVCGQEFDSSRDWDFKNKISSYNVCKNHEINCVGRK